MVSSAAAAYAALGLPPPGLRRQLAAGSRSRCLSVRAEASPVAGFGVKVLDDTVIEKRGLRDFVEQSRDLIRPDGGPPRWFSPLEAGARAEGSPLLLFLPGIDGVGLGLIRHHQRLGKIFDIWCLHIPVKDRTSFEGLVEYVEFTVKSENCCLPNKPIYLVGESLGACVALAVAARNPTIDFILILANPGTSFSNSQLQSLSSFLSIVPEPLHITIPHFLNFMTGNSMRMTSTYVENVLSLQHTITGVSESLADVLPTLSFLADIMPKESLLWKMKMLRSASFYVNSRLHTVKAQVLILASGRDQLLPSSDEAERICRAVPNCRIRHFNNSGHFILLEGDCDLVTTIKGACYYRRSRHMDYVSDYLLPTPTEFQKASEQYRWVNFAASPVMFSTLKNGKIVKGLSGVPSAGPAVLVGYHMLMGFELGPLVIRFLSEKNIHLRGIAHPLFFNKELEHAMPDSASFDNHRIMGAAPVTAANFYKLLSKKSHVLLYPGGAREALHRKVLLDYDDLVKLPFYDILSNNLNKEAVTLRTDYNEEVGNQILHLPGLLPKFPGRFYYLFGRPIETKGRMAELRDRDKAQQMYVQVKSEVEECIAYLKEKREKDPYRNLFSRLTYQASTGFTTEVPTFEP